MAAGKSRRTPKNYDGTELTTHHVTDLLPSVLTRITDRYQERPDLILAVWSEIIGPQLAPMTQAVSFVDEVLTVKVRNSTLHSLLTQHDKPRILGILRQKFPKISIKNVVFRIG